jgi:hypothetical protein
VNAVVVELNRMAFLVSLCRIKGMSTQLRLSIDIEADVDAVVNAAEVTVVVFIVIVVLQHFS